MAESNYTEISGEVIQNTRKAKFKCSHCYKFLSSRQNLREHLYIHTGEKPYVCNEPECDQSFRQGSLLSIHKKIHSEVKKAQIPNVPNQKIVYPKLTSLIPSSSDVHLNLPKDDIESLISQIPANKFLFIKEYLK